MAGPSREDVINEFTYHSPLPEEVEKLDAINEAALQLALVIYDRCPASADRTAAIRKVSEARMTANKSIVCGRAAG